MMSRIALCAALVCLSLTGFSQTNSVDKTKAAIATQESVPADVLAEAVRKRYIAAVGGEPAISAVKDIKLTYSATMQDMQLAITDWKSDGKSKREIYYMGNLMQKALYTGDTGIIETRGQPQKMNPEQLETAKRDADIQGMLHPEVYGMKRVFLHTLQEPVGSIDVLEVTDSKGAKAKEFYSVATGLLIRETHSTQGPKGALQVIVAFGDYRELPGMGGYRIPFSIRQVTGDKEFEAHVETAEVNKGISDAVFK